jgi:hypothetical protein
VPQENLAGRGNLFAGIKKRPGHARFPEAPVCGSCGYCFCPGDNCNARNIILLDDRHNIRRPQALTSSPRE